MGLDRGGRCGDLVFFWEEKVKTEHLIIVAGLAAAVYFLWYKPKKNAEKAVESVAKETAQVAGANLGAAFGVPLPVWKPQTADTIAV